jgi:tryptophan 2-C-methyltransferase
MLVLVNSNRLEPPIAPLGLDYVANAARDCSVPTEVIDLGLAEGRWATELARLGALSPRLVGVSLRNVDDCFWPSATSYLPEACQIIERVRELTDAPIVVGGVGFSIFGQGVLSAVGADFGIRGDGECATIDLYRTLSQPARWSEVEGLIWSYRGAWLSNPLGTSEAMDRAHLRDQVDNRHYLRRGGQIGIETKRGCPRKCVYCADPIAKGARVRCRPPELVADEFETLLGQGIDVFHLCDSEFNVPRAHALAVCDALIRRAIGERMQFYAYLAVRPFDFELAMAMKRAGCAGINFTGDSGSDDMLLRYRAAHRQAHLAEAVRLCRTVGITCMIDLLLGGPGETPETLMETIQFVKRIDPDCVGAALGVRLYPHTLTAQMLERDGTLESGAGIRRRYQGPIELMMPTFYVSPSLGSHPARLVREVIASDPRFFPPADDSRSPDGGDDHNYSDNSSLSEAIARGARGAYWDILRRERRGSGRS